ANNTVFSLTPANAGHVTAFVNGGVTSTPFVLSPTVNTVTANLAAINPNSALQNQQNVPILRMQLSVNNNTARILKLKFNRLGAPNGGLDSDVSVVKVWKDPNGLGAFDLSVTTQLPDGSFPNLLSFGNESFSSNTVNLLLKTPIVVSTTPAFYFVT